MGWKGAGPQPSPGAGAGLLLAVLHQLPQQFLPLGVQGRVPRVSHRFQGVQVGFLPDRRETAWEHWSPGQATGLISPGCFQPKLRDL